MRSACIAGGLIEALDVDMPMVDAGVRSACIAGGLIEAPSDRSSRGARPTCVPPVLQAASLKPLDGARFLPRGRSRSACIAGGLIEACRRRRS